MRGKWQDNVAQAFVEVGKLGMEVVLGTGPGWAGSGGSWVGVEDSMQHLVGSGVKVSGPGVLNQKAYRIHKSANLTDWTLWEDFGVISGNHAAVLPLANEGDRQFYKLGSYQP